MTERTVKVVLKADASSLVASMRTASKATDDFAKNATKSATTNKKDWQTLGTTSMVAGGAIALGVGFAVKAFMGFDKEMSNVAAVSGATAGEMDKLRQAALKAGADTKFSASEAATAEAELAKAGVSTAEILGGALTGSLNLAAAGNLDLGKAAEISAQAMNIFKLEGKDVAHIADVLASGANKSAADVSSLGEALKQGGLVAEQTGLHLEDTVGVLSMFADSALVGSDAGTSLKTMLARLVPSSDEAAGAMEEIGFSAYDAQGKFVGMESVAQQLKDGLGGLSEEQRAATMNTIFGSDAVRAASILYDKGAAGVKEYTTAVNDEGAAARVAAIQMDNLAGDLDALKGSIETALIQTGSGGNDALRGMAQFATDAVNSFGELPVPLQKSALGLAAVTSAGLLTVGAVGTMYPKIVETKKAMSDLAGSSKLAGGAMKGLSAAAGIAAGLAVAAAAAVAISNAMQDAVPGIEATTAALLDSGNAAENVDALFAGLYDTENGVNDLASAFDRLTNKSFNESFNDKIGGMFGEITDATKSAEVFNNIGTSLGKLVASGHADKAKAQFDAMATKLGLTGAEVDQLMKLMPAYGESLAGVANEAKLAASATGAAGTAVAGAGDKAQIAAAAANKLKVEEESLAKAADEVKKKHDTLIDSITNFGNAMLTARGDARGYEAAIDAAAASVKENGRTLDITTEKGRNNADALDGIATSALKAAESNLTNAEANGTLSKTSKNVAGDVDKARTAFINQAVSMGMNKKAAGELATQSGLTSGRVQDITNKLIDLGKQKPKPKADLDKAAAEAKIKTLQANIDAIKQGKVPGVNANTAAGKAKIAELQRQINALKQPKPVEIKYYFTPTGKLPPKFVPSWITPAAGGYIHGPGTGTSDSIPAMVSNGEYVVKAAAVDKIGVAALDRINSMRFAAGGYAGPRSSSAASTANAAPSTQVTINGNVGWNPDEVARRIATRQCDAAALYNLAGV